MKILGLDLQAFGPFTGVSLDFSGGAEGLHIVHGPNEAGKSSAMRGLRQALFGFPHQSDDNFLHDYKKFRVGMRLRDDEGRELAFVRRKALKNALMDPDGAPLPDSLLSKVLGGLTEDEFARRYALDHDELVAGGRSILEGSGELGQLLFQAGGGLKDLFEVRRQIDRELEALFKPTGIKPRINESLGELKDARAQVREGSLPSSEWVEHDSAHRRASEELARVEELLESARAEKRRLDRIAGALPILARRDQFDRELRAIGPVVDLPDDFAEHRHQADAELDTARRAEADALAEIVEIDARLVEIVVPDDLLDRVDAIERLRDALGGYRKAEAALPAEVASLQRIEDEVRGILDELRPDGGPVLVRRHQDGGDPAPGPPEGGTPTGPSPTPGLGSLLESRLQPESGTEKIPPEGGTPTSPSASARLESRLQPESGRAKAHDPEVDALLEAAEAVHLKRTQKSTISRLAAELARLTADQDIAVAEVAAMDDRIESERAELERLGEPADPGPIIAALRQARDQGDLDAMVEEARARLDRAVAEADRAMARLPLRSGTLDDLAGRPVPSAETVDRAEADLAAAVAELDRLRSARETADADAHAADARLAAIREATGVLPTEDDLDDARRRRDRIWRPIRLALESGRLPDEAEVLAVIDDGSNAIATAFEQATVRADALADRLRREAERVAAQAVARADRERARQRSASLAEPIRQVEGRADEARERWRSTWEPTGIDPLSPREMRAWLLERQAVVQRADDARARRDELEALRARVASHRESIGRAMETVGEEPDPVGISDSLMGPVRDRAEAAVNRMSRAMSRREELVQSIGQACRQLEAARGRVRTSADRLRVWREAWGRAVAPLRLPPESAPEQADAVIEQVDGLAARVKEARAARLRIDDRRREVDRFVAEVEALDDLGGTSSTVADRARELIRRLAVARKAADDREALRLRREHRRDASDEARRRREAAAARLEGLRREAGCAAVEDLPAAARASAAARALRDRIRDLDGQLGGLCGLEPIVAFRDACAAVDADRLPDRIVAIADEADRLAADRDALIDERARSRTELARMDGQGRAAEANERVEYLKSRLAQEVEEYARLRLAAVVLREAIDRYREKTQGPVIDRAGALFAGLTLGSFLGLRVDYDDPDRPALVAVRPPGDEPPAVGIRGLSLGTADQLYLALRLAGLEAAVAARGPVPLIIDDILIQFDDRRTAAALAILAQLSARTQVLLFTHHEHVCDLARSTLQPDHLFIHRLPGRFA